MQRAPQVEERRSAAPVLAGHMKVDHISIYQDSSYVRGDKRSTPCRCEQEDGEFDTNWFVKKIVSVWSARAKSIGLTSTQTLIYAEAELSKTVDYLNYNVFANFVDKREFETPLGRDVAERMRSNLKRRYTSAINEPQTEENKKDKKKKKTGPENQSAFVVYRETRGNSKGNLVVRNTSNVENYAKTKLKNNDYISVYPVNDLEGDGPRRFVVKLREEEPTLFSGANLVYDGELDKLYDELVDRRARYTYEKSVNIEYVRSPSQPPPVSKKTKTETASSENFKKAKPSSVRIREDTVMRSYVEERTSDEGEDTEEEEEEKTVRGPDPIEEQLDKMENGERRCENDEEVTGSDERLEREMSESVCSSPPSPYMKEKKHKRERKP